MMLSNINGNLSLWLMTSLPSTPDADLKLYLLPQPGDWPAQFYSRQIVYETLLKFSQPVPTCLSSSATNSYNEHTYAVPHCSVPSCTVTGEEAWMIFEGCSHSFHLKCMSDDINFCPLCQQFHYLFHSNLETSKNSPHSKAILQLSIKSLTVGSVDIQEKVINFQRIEMFNVLTVKMAFVQAMFVQGKHSRHHIHWQ